MTSKKGGLEYQRADSKNPEKKKKKDCDIESAGGKDGKKTVLATVKGRLYSCQNRRPSTESKTESGETPTQKDEVGEGKTTDREGGSDLGGEKVTQGKKNQYLRRP